MIAAPRDIREKISRPRPIIPLGYLCLVVKLSPYPHLSHVRSNCSCPGSRARENCAFAPFNRQCRCCNSVRVGGNFMLGLAQWIQNLFTPSIHAFPSWAGLAPRKEMCVDFSICLYFCIFVCLSLEFALHFLILHVRYTL